MRQPRTAVFVFALAAALPASALDRAALDADAERLEPRVIDWRRDFHRHPELGNREVRTAAKVAEHLRGLGLAVETGIAHTGVVALIEGGRPGPRIALRADMDALPVTERTDLPFRSTATAEFRGETVGVMHACGHDAHVAILMGVAEALVAHRESLPGSVLLIFQPAEEGPPDGEEGGAELMLEQGLFARYRPEAIVGLHVFSTLHVGQIGLRAGPMMAESDRFRILVKGRQTHGARPWGGVDPVLAAAHIVTGLQGIVSRRVDITRSPAVVSIGAVKGGIRYNIVPDEVELLGTVRHFDTAVRDAIYADIRRIAENTAAAAGASATVETWEHTRVLVNDPAFTRRMRPSLDAVAGAANVVEMPFQTVAEDFALFADEVPGLYFFVGITPRDQDPMTAPSNHSPEFRIDEAGLRLGVRAMLRLTADFLDPPAAAAP